MTGQQINRDQLRELASGATPGPWIPHPSYVWTSELGGIIQNWSEDANAAADMEFIAAARQAVPALLDMLDQAEADRDWNIRSSRLSKEERIKANARADQAEARIQAVRDVLDRPADDTEDMDSISAHYANGYEIALQDIRRALDGEQ